MGRVGVDMQVSTRSYRGRVLDEGGYLGVNLLDGVIVELRKDGAELVASEAGWSSQVKSSQ